MGTGKTNVGKEIARRRKWQFLDLDDLIEMKERKVIADIFARNGEPYFRRREKEALKEAARQDNFVVACGGGVVIDPENIEIMRKSGILICLTAKPEVILKRTSGYGHRPLLNVKDPRRQIGLLLKLRHPYYALADKTIDTSKLSVKQVADKILRLSFKSKGSASGTKARNTGRKLRSKR